MPFMDNVNRLISRVGIPGLVLFYLAVLWFDHTADSERGLRALVEAHYENLDENGDIDAIILGGSNSMYSLSAAMLAKLSGIRWYNASLIREGYNDANYHAFVDRLTAKIDRSRVRVVVFSTIYPFQAGGLDRRAKAQENLVGVDQRLSFKPNESAFWHLHDLAAGDTQRYPLPDLNGDLDFSRFSCRTRAPRDLKFEHDDPGKSAATMYGNIEYIANLFPAAEIVAALPSEYYGDLDVDDRRKAFNDRLISDLENRITGSPALAGRNIAVVAQSPFPDSALVCDKPHHGNAAGRHFRTQDLFDQLTKEAVDAGTFDATVFSQSAAWREASK